MTDDIPSSNDGVDPLTHDRVDRVVLSLSLGGDASCVYVVDSPVNENETEYLTAVHGDDRFYPVLVTISDASARWRHAQDDEIIWAIRQGLQHVDPPERLREYVESNAEAMTD